MPHLRTHFRSLLCFVLFLLPSLGAYASHIVGADLTYSWVSGNTYKVTMAVYADCGPPSAAAFSTLPTGTPQVCIYNGTTSIGTMTLTLNPPTTGTEVTPTLCPGDISQCTSTSSMIPGITLFTYSANYTLPSTSASWRFVFNGAFISSSAGRASAITNIVGAGATITQLEATLNNMSAPNTNPVLHIIPLPYYALNVPQSYNPVAIDAVDGDSLVYSLVPAINATGACTMGAPVSYTGTAWGTTAVSATAPFRVASGSFSFNSYTGSMLFLPDYVQRSIAVYEIKEYRAGVLVGSLQREITILVNPSTNHLPRGQFASPVSCTMVDSVHLLVCDTVGAFSVQIPGLDADAPDTINVTTLGIPAGATFTTVGNNTPTPVSTFSWNTTLASATPGLHNFYVTYTDNSCPMNGSQTICFSVYVTNCAMLPPPPPPTSVTDKGLTAPGIKIFPNPSRGAFTIESTTAFDNATITITDVLGRVVRQEEITDNSKRTSFDLENVAEGTYSVRVVMGNKTYCEKMVVYR